MFPVNPVGISGFGQFTIVTNNRSPQEESDQRHIAILKESINSLEIQLDTLYEDTGQENKKISCVPCHDIWNSLMDANDKSKKANDEINNTRFFNPLHTIQKILNEIKKLLTESGLKEKLKEQRDLLHQTAEQLI